jgi:hypothetical protein
VKKPAKRAVAASRRELQSAASSARDRWQDAKKSAKRAKQAAKHARRQFKDAKKVVKRAKEEMLAAARKLQSLVAGVARRRAKAKSKATAAAKAASPRPRPKAKAVARPKPSLRPRTERQVVAPAAAETVSTIAPEVTSEDPESKVA